jgi:hypothetical protein
MYLSVTLPYHAYRVCELHGFFNYCRERKKILMMVGSLAIPEENMCQGDLMATCFGRVVAYE